MKEKMSFTGKLDIYLKDANGVLVDEQHVHNLVVNVGKNWIISRMVASSDPFMDYMAIGTNNTAPTNLDTALQNEVARVSSSTSSASNQVMYTGVFGAGVGTGVIVEAGIFNAASVGTMLARSTALTVNKGPTDTLTIVWTVTAN